MNLADALKQSTAEAHKRAESRDLQRRLVQGRLEDDRLAAYLAQLQLVHAALERHFDDHESVAATIGWHDGFRHSARIGVDLDALDLVTDRDSNEATRSALDAIDTAVGADPFALLGFFYVLEGSMNGNRFIVRALRHTPAAARCSFTYFDPYGDEQPARWGAFREALARTGFDADRDRRVLDAALTMFDAISEIADEVTTPAFA
jgi:heme oxygenase